MIIDPQGSEKDPMDEAPFIGRTGKGDMRTTEPLGSFMIYNDEIVLLDLDTYKLLLEGVRELYQRDHP